MLMTFPQMPMVETQIQQNWKIPMKTKINHLQTNSLEMRKKLPSEEEDQDDALDGDAGQDKEVDDPGEAHVAGFHDQLQHGSNKMEIRGV